MCGITEYKLQTKTSSHIYLKYAIYKRAGYCGQSSWVLNVTMARRVIYLWTKLLHKLALLWWIITNPLSAAASWLTVYPKKYAHGLVVLCFVVVMQSFIMNSHEVFIHIHQGCFAGTGAIVRLPQCQWSKPDGYGKISQCMTTTKHSKAKTVCIFLGIYCTIRLGHSGWHLEIDGLVQERRNSIALAMELHLSCINQLSDGLVQERHNSRVLAMELRLSCFNPSRW